jgi:hypothetical protein
MFLLVLLAGAAGAATLLAVCALGRLHRSIGFYAGLLTAVSLTYPLFAVERFDYSSGLWHLGGATAFILLGSAAARIGSGALLGLGFLGHAVLDLLGIPWGFHGPLFWGEFCVGFDLVLALAARFFLKA